MVPPLVVRGRRHGSLCGRPRVCAAGLFFADKKRAWRHAAPMFDLRIEQGVARLVLDRPEARNAVPAGQWERLGAAAAKAESEGARLLIVSGAGGAFCAGADLGDFPGLIENEGARASFRLAMRAGLDRIANLDIPAIAAIDGACFGAGVALAMACDLRVAGPDARFAITPAKLGISYPQEDVHQLVSLVGPGQAARLLFGAETIDAAEAVRIGLVESCASSAEGYEALVEGLSEAILANSADSLRLLKRSIRSVEKGAGADTDLDKAFDAAFGSAEFAERLAALRPRAATR